MRIRIKDKPEITGWSSQLNTHSLNEIIVGYDDGDMSSDYIRNYECLLKDGSWKNLAEAFRDKDIITDNYNTKFREPLNDEEYQRGWYD